MHFQSTFLGAPEIQNFEKCRNLQRRCNFIKACMFLGFCLNQNHNRVFVGYLDAKCNVEFKTLFKCNCLKVPSLPQTQQIL